MKGQQMEHAGSEHHLPRSFLFTKQGSESAVIDQTCTNQPRQPGARIEKGLRQQRLVFTKPLYSKNTDASF
jgi:hypothetical protein